MPTDTSEEAQELQPSSKKVESCGICRPPKDVGQNHKPLPNLPPLTDLSKFKITGQEVDGITRRRSQ